jgi:PBP1b-binding outer membrane lipoprotein LpoB
MKKLFAVLTLTVFLLSCGNETENQSDNEKASSSEAAEAADRTNMIDKAQEKANAAVDTLQSKGGKIIEAAGDTLQNKVVEPVKTEVKKIGEKIKEEVQKAKEKVNTQ